MNERQELQSMSKTSSAAKQRYNAAHYAQVKISVAPELAMNFKAVCAQSGMSIAGEMSRLMHERCGTKAPSPKNASGITDATTRDRRRRLIKSIIRQVELVKDAEEQYLENMPENLHGSERHDAAESCIAALEEALALLAEAY